MNSTRPSAFLEDGHPGGDRNSDGLGGGGGVDAFAGVDNGVKQIWKEDLISYHNGYI